MTRLTFSTFGGMFPSTEARVLPDNAAQVATDLMAASGEFRPVKADTQVVANSGLTAPKTIFRFQYLAGGAINTDYTSMAGWKVYAADVNIAKWPVDDAGKDRHILAYNDGLTAPRYFNNAGDDYPLGVPRPVSAPTLVVNVVDEFTVEERAAEMDAIRQTYIGLIQANCAIQWVGATDPGTGTTGYIDRKTTYGFPADDLTQMVRAYRLSGTGGTISNAYASGMTGDDFTWLFDPLAPTLLWSAAATPSWAGGAATKHIGISFHAYGQGYSFNKAAAKIAFAAVLMPGLSDGTKALTTPQVNALADKIEATLDPDHPDIKPSVDGLASRVQELKNLLDQGNNASAVAQLTAYWSKSAIAQVWTDAIAQFAEEVYGAAFAVAHSSVPIDYTGSGA